MRIRFPVLPASAVLRGTAFLLVCLWTVVPDLANAGDIPIPGPTKPPAVGQSAITPADYVNVFTGKGGARWMYGPGPWMPNGMVKIAPDNKVQAYRSGYDGSYKFINCFSHIHEWTMAGLGMMPTVGPLRTQPGLDGTGYSSHASTRPRSAAASDITTCCSGTAASRSN